LRTIPIRTGEGSARVALVQMEAGWSPTAPPAGMTAETAADGQVFTLGPFSIG
jgi:hypothetical protein